MRSAAVLLLGLSVAGAGTATTPVIEFPGTVKELRSPNGTMRVTYVQLPGKPSEIATYELRVEAVGERPQRILSFERDATLQWSSDSKSLYISNVWGSNVADCYVAWPSKHPLKLVNLTEVIYRLFPEPAKFLKHADHGYVVCDGWNDPGHLRFTVYGDIFPAEYRYTFVYDLKAGAAKQLSAKVTKTNR